MNVKREEECYDASTDDEGGAPIGRPMLKAVVVKKEEDVDTDDEMQAAEKSRQGGGSSGAFEKRLEELKAYKSKRGHLKVKKSEDKSLHQFCINIRSARRGTGNMKLTEERIAFLDDLGFDWEPQSKSKRDSSFQERLEALRAYKAKHGHLAVKRSEDKSLAVFCDGIRQARRNPESRRRTLTEDRIASLDALGFDWAPQRKNEQSFQERIVLKKEEDVDTQNTDATPEVNNAAEKTAAQDNGKGSQRRVIKTFEEKLQELQAYKAEHGHLKVKKSEDKSLYHFCQNARRARRGEGTMTVTNERIAALDNLGFDWGVVKETKSFQERVEALEAYKAEHGHVKVKESEDKSLALFCRAIRNARRGTAQRKLTEDRVASLDALGFDWGVGRAQSTKAKTFQERVEDLAAYKAEHGHLKVKESADKSLAQFCAQIRQARKGRGTMKLDEERIAALNEVGFDWAPEREGRPNERSFQEKVEALNSYKANHGHLKVTKSENKSLYLFCYSIRRARRGRGNMKLDEERIASLDAIGFDWKMLPGNEHVESEEQSTESTLPPMPNLPHPLPSDSDDIDIVEV